MKSIILCTLVAATIAATSASQKSQKPELFDLTAQVTGIAGSAAGSMKLQIDRYVADADRETIARALKDGGTAAFLAALRKAPALGRLTTRERTHTVRWATQVPIKNGRTIVAVTDTPVFYVGGGLLDAKPRDGFEVGVIRFNFDDAGLGTGTMAAAARVKPGGATGVELDDYAAEPIKLRIAKAYS